MPITVTCDQCGKVLKAPDSAAGKVGRCPSCGQTMTLGAPVDGMPPPMEGAAPRMAPAAEPQAPPSPFDEPVDGEPMDAEPVGGEPNIGYSPNVPVPPTEPQQERRPCPICGEMIAVGAIRCRFCSQGMTADGQQMAGRPGATSGKAVGALVCGLIGLLACPPVGIAGVVFAQGAKREIAESGGQLDGGGMATAGLVTGIIAIVFLGIWVLWFLFVILMAGIGGSM